jgi:hypothetical protein
VYLNDAVFGKSYFRDASANCRPPLSNDEKFIASQTFVFPQSQSAYSSSRSLSMVMAPPVVSAVWHGTIVPMSARV